MLQEKPVAPIAPVRSKEYLTPKTSWTPELMKTFMDDHKTLSQEELIKRWGLKDHKALYNMVWRINKLYNELLTKKNVEGATKA